MREDEGKILRGFKEVDKEFLEERRSNLNGQVGREVNGIEMHMDVIILKKERKEMNIRSDIDVTYQLPK